MLGAFFVLFVLFIVLSFEKVLPAPVRPAHVRGKGITSKYHRPELPGDLDVSTISLKDLVDLKPRHHYSTKGQMYKQYFSQHPDIQKINLYQSEPIKTAQLLLNLKGDNKEWNTKITTSVRNYISGATFQDEKQRKALQEMLKGKRHESSRKERSQRFRSKWGPEEMAIRRHQREDRYLKENGTKYRNRQQQRTSLENKPLSIHLGEEGDKMTAAQVEEKSRSLSEFYSNPATLTKELGKYLRRKKVPDQEYAAAMAARASVIYNIDREKRTKKRKVSTPSASTSKESGPSKSPVRSSPQAASS